MRSGRRIGYRVMPHASSDRMAYAVPATAKLWPPSKVPAPSAGVRLPNDRSNIIASLLLYRKADVKPWRRVGPAPDFVHLSPES